MFEKKEEKYFITIQAVETCFNNIDKEKFKEWTELSRKRSKSVYQYKYVDRGDHTKTKNKYKAKKRKIKRT